MKGSEREQREGEPREIAEGENLLEGKTETDRVRGREGKAEGKGRIVFFCYLLFFLEVAWREPEGRGWDES